MYSKKIIDRFKNPRFAGTIKDADSTGEVGNIKCGDIMKLFLKIRKDKKDRYIIKDIRFQTYGCIAAIASTDYLCELAKGKSLDDALKITSKDIVKKMGKVPNIKIHCSILAQDALKKAIQDFKKKVQDDKK